MYTQLKTKIIYGDYEIPVEIGSMVKTFETKTEGACPHCQAKTGAKKYCKGCDAELGWKEPLTAYRFSKDEIQIITDEQYALLETQTKRIIVRGTQKVENIDVRSTLGGYYLGIRKSELTSKKDKEEQDEQNKALFSMLYCGLKNTGKALVVDFAVGKKPKNGLLIADHGTIILKQVTNKGEILEFDEEFPSDVSREMADEATGFIESLKEIDPQSIENVSKQTLEKILKGEPLPVITKKKPSLNFFKVAKD